MPAAQTAGRRRWRSPGGRTFAAAGPTPEGLREVYFRYDDELEYWAKANNFATEIEKYSGTKVYDFPVVLSARFDDAGMLVGIRIVSDPRDTSRDREEVYPLRNFLIRALSSARAGTASIFRATTARRRCSGHSSSSAAARPSMGRGADLQTAYFARRAKASTTPAPTRDTEGQFESLVRFELTVSCDRSRVPTDVGSLNHPEHEDHGRVGQMPHLRRARELVLGVPEQAGGNRDILLAVDRIGHRRRIEAGADIDLPQLLERLVVERHDRAVEQRRDHDAAGGREHAGGVRIRQVLARTCFIGRGVDQRRCCW